MTWLPELRSGAVERPASGVRRWLSAAERAALSESAAARLSLARALGAGSPAAGPIETWLSGIDNDNTRAGYAADVRAFVEWLRERHQLEADEAWVDLLAVNMDVVADYADAMRALAGRYGKPLSPATRARRLASLSAMYTHLASRRVVPTNPVRELERPKVDTEGTTPARSSAEIAAMVQAAGVSARDLAVVLLLYVSAFRVTEVCRARVDQLHREGGRTLLTVPIKGGRKRNELLDPAVVEVVELSLGGRASGPLLLADSGQALQRHHVGPTAGLTRLLLPAYLPRPLTWPKHGEPPRSTRRTQAPPRP